MYALTQKGLNYINKQRGMLSAWAKEILAQECTKEHPEIDGWWAFNIVEHRRWEHGDQQTDLVYVNIWQDEETEEWKATAYPIEVNSIGEVQVNYQDFSPLWKTKDCLNFIYL